MSAVATRFGAESTAAEVIAGIDLTGKRAIVTGASSGIGPGYMQQVRASARLRIKTVEHGAAGVAPYALDPDNADRLWEVSSRLVNA